MTNDKLLTFDEQGYKIQQELGHNLSGGRITYLATTTKSEQPVVIKQFQFAKVGASWSEYKAHEREIALLQQLNSPSIPQYLNSFETPDGFCLVQEYKPAPSLAKPQPFTPQEIKQIAIATLEVLVYLQQQIPPVIHRDIKPENLLIDRSPKIKVYLVDFGLARSADGDVAASSVVKGTLGFMPPEQMFNRQLTTASDLYSLGVTLICLLTQTKSTEIGNLIDEANRINFKPLVKEGRRQEAGGRREESLWGKLFNLFSRFGYFHRAALVPQLNPRFINWLEKMVAPNLKHRYPNAATALAALEPIEVVRNSTSRWGEIKNPLGWKLTKLILISLSGIALLSIGLNNVNQSNSGDELKQLLETGECQSCDLRGLDLRNAELQGVDLTAADLTDADLRGADLRSTDLENINLTASDLRGADLRGADLRGANLRNANLRSANFRSAYLNDADLRGAILPDGSLNP